MSSRIHVSPARFDQALTTGALVVLLLSALSATSAAQAQMSTPAATPDRGSRVDGDIKGTVGLGLLGLELGLVLTPLAKLQDRTWAWSTLPAVGAAVGATVGYFALERGDPNRAVSLSLLGTGMGLLVPAVFTSAWLVHKRRMSDVRTSAAAPAGLLRWERGQLRAGAPALALIPRQSAGERRGGLAARAELRVPLFAGRF